MRDVNHLVALFDQFRPQSVLQFIETLMRHGGEEAHLHRSRVVAPLVRRLGCLGVVDGMLGKVFPEVLDGIGVHSVTFGNAQHTRLREQFGVIFTQFVEQDLVLAQDSVGRADSAFQVVGRGRNEEQQDSVAFDMPQETESQTFAFGCPLDDSGDVRHAERLFVAIGDNAQLRRKCSERIVGYLGFGGADYREERRFACIGEAHEAHVRQNLELQDDVLFLTRLAGLRVTRGLIGGSAEMPVSQSSAAAFEQNYLLPVLFDLAEELARVAVIHDRPAGHLDDLVLPIFAEGAGLAAVTAVCGHDMLLILQVQQRPQVAVSAQDDMSATTSIASVRAAFGHVLSAMEMQRTCSTFA